MMLHAAKALSEVVSLGPPCRTCQRRRVKCDSSMPTCQRCKKDGKQCIGYQKPLKIKQYQPKNINGHTDPSLQASITSSPSPYDRDDLVLIDSVQCYNEYILPKLFPAHRPFKRQEVPAASYLLFLPKVMRSVFILTFRSLQSAGNSLAPASQPEISHYRGLSYSELNHFLPDAGTDPYGIALGCILMLLGSDILSSPTEGSWYTHMCAARRTIMLRGGLQATVDAFPSFRQLLVNYITIDILTATTCPSNLLFADGSGQRSMQHHYEHIAVLPNVEGEILSSSQPLPIDILAAIVRTNLLRNFVRDWDDASRVRDTQQTRDVLVGGPSSFYLTGFAQILDSIKAFDPFAWAPYALQYGQAQPMAVDEGLAPESVDGFSSLALCYKSAALMYLVLSTTFVDSVKLIKAVREAKRTLDEQVGLLLATADFENEDGPLHTQLWKFVTWPMFVSVYARIGWDIGEDGTSAEQELNRLQATAKEMRSTKLGNVVRQLRSVREGKEKMQRRRWMWDDGFEVRSTFGL